MRMGLERNSFDSSAACFSAVSGDRDTKDYHTAKLSETATYSKDCTEALYAMIPRRKSLPDVGKHSFDELVKANPCGTDGS